MFFIFYKSVKESAEYICVSDLHSRNKVSLLQNHMDGKVMRRRWNYTFLWWNTTKICKSNQHYVRLSFYGKHIITSMQQMLIQLWKHGFCVLTWERDEAALGGAGWGLWRLRGFSNFCLIYLFDCLKSTNGCLSVLLYLCEWRCSISGKAEGALLARPHLPANPLNHRLSIP